MTVNAQDFLESIQRAAGQKPKKKTHKMLTAAPDLSVFGIPDGRSSQIGTAREDVPFPLPDAKALKEGVLPKNSRKQKAAADEETAANGSSIQALIAKAVQAKKAMESKSDIAQRLIKTEHAI